MGTPQGLTPLQMLAQMAKAVGEFQERIRQWFEQNGEALNLFFQQLAESVAAFEHYRNEQEAKDFAALAQGGWIGLERHFSYARIRVAAKICRTMGTDAMNEAMLSYFNNDDFGALKKMTADWANVPYLKDRQPIIQDALTARSKGQYTLTIPALLPLAEGLAAETLGTTSVKAVQLAATAWNAEEAEAWSQEFWNVVNQVIYKSYQFGRDPSTYLNRHGILHGRVPDYASAYNSTRVFLLVDAISHFWTSSQKAAPPQPASP
jgi:hypothetical protein